MSYLSFLKHHVPLIAGSLLGFVVLLLVVFVRPSSVFPNPPASQTSSQTKQVITWTPFAASGEVALGKSKTISVMFTSSKKIRRASVEVSPELTPFAQVTPAFLERIRKGESRQIQLVFSAAATSRPGTLNGTIQLRKGKKEKGDKPDDDDADVPEGKLLAQPLPITLLITVVPLPPDPGEAGKAPLEGIDSDGDGVRDDIQRYIALTYPDSEKTRAALAQSTKALQEALLDAENKDASLHHAKVERADAVYCLMAVFGIEGSVVPFGELRAEILNTDERSEAYIKSQEQFGGEVFESVPESEWKSHCTFDLDAMRN